METSFWCWTFETYYGRLEVLVGVLFMLSVLASFVGSLIYLGCKEKSQDSEADVVWFYLGRVMFWVVLPTGFLLFGNPGSRIMARLFGVCGT